MDIDDEEIIENDITDEDKDLMMQLLVENEEDLFVEFLRDNLEELERRIYVASKTAYDIYDENTDYEDYYSSTDSLELAKEFLKSINPKYELEFERLIASGEIDIINEPSPFDEGGVDRENAKHLGLLDIHLPLQHTLYDVNLFVHEFFHAINDYGDNNTDKEFLSELPSIFSEFLLFDFLKNKNVNQEENNLMIQTRLGYLLDISFDINEIIYTLKETLSEMNLNYKEQSKEQLDNLKYCMEDDIRYFLSTTIAIYLYYEYKHNRLTLKNIEEFMQRVNYLDDFNSLSYIFSKDDMEDEDIAKSIEYLGEQLNNNKSMQR